MKNAVVQSLTENLNYKLVSLFIAIILWVTILGRRDFVYTKVMNVDARIGSGLAVHRSSDQVRVRVSGTRSALKKFMEDDRTEVLPVDLRERGAGVYDFEMTPDVIKVPLGVKVLGVRPSIVRFEIYPVTATEEPLTPPQDSQHE